MGSAADLKYGRQAAAAARELGRQLAALGCTVVYGAERDYGSLPTEAATAAAEAGGLTVGVTYGKGRDIGPAGGRPGVTIATGLERGGGREFVLVNSCDAVVLISGGSGTLCEATIAYQSGIPIVAMSGFGGWADRLAGGYLDSRRRIRVAKAATPLEAARAAFKLAGASVGGSRKGRRLKPTS